MRPSAPRARVAALFLATATAACGGGGGGGARGPWPGGRTLPDARPTERAAGVAGDDLPSFDALAARGPDEAPLMHEAQRIEHVVGAVPVVRAEHDTCVRVVFASPREVRVWLADDTGALRGDTTGPAKARSLRAVRRA